ncbi:MAG: ligase-associated DNA damage response exonuclease [Saprospiraceae bacterium]|nr:ligase-associated DNA damage response exonuclease [Saprospiraceae bacterium]
MALVQFRPEGFYVPAADVYIDPWRKVERAIITHGHADHSRWGHGSYVCSALSEPIIRHRLGKIKLNSYDYGDTFSVRGVKFSLIPAGHIVGSAQVRIEHKGEVWVISGDYKVEDDGISGAFEPVPCHTFISECTFGLPVYNWLPQKQVLSEINAWWRENQENGVTSVLTAYSLGKAQRLLAGLDTDIGPIFTHGAIEEMTQVIRRSGLSLPATRQLTDDVRKADLPLALVLTPPGATGTAWMRRFKKVSIASASGWMQLRGTRRRGSLDRGFVLSDHADWDGLNLAIQATGAENVYVTHGYTHVFARWLKSKGINAGVVETQFSNDGNEASDQLVSS